MNPNYRQQAVLNSHSQQQAQQPPQQQLQQQQQSQNQQNRRGPRRPSTLVYGNAQAGDDAERFNLAADVNLVAFGVSKDASPDQFKEYLVARGLRVTDIELITKFRINECRSYTYCVAIKAEDYEKALDPHIWPHRVGIRLFKNKRTQPDLLSWNQQSNAKNNQLNQNNLRNSTPRHQSSPQPTISVESPLQITNRFVAAGFATEVTN